jgi:hypothetical protein
MSGAGAIFFTHIPKIGGTRLDRTLFRETVPDADVFQPRGFRDLLTSNRSFAYLPGHRPYGIYRLSTMSEEPRYCTMLRDPVERAISFHCECLWPRGNKKVAESL